MQSSHIGSSPYTLTDFYLVSFLLCKGFKLEGTEILGSNRVAFLVGGISGQHHLIQDFYAHKATVDPLSYKDSIMNLKSMLHGIKNEGRSAGSNGPREPRDA